MKIINKTKGPIYYSTSFPLSSAYPSGAADCGKIELNEEVYLGYKDVEGSASISLLKDDNSNGSDGSFQEFAIKGSSDIVVEISVK